MVQLLFWHGPFEIYMSRGLEFWSHRLSGSADVNSSESNDDAAITPLLSVLGSLAREFGEQNMKEPRSKLSHIFLWHGLAVTQMYCHGPVSNTATKKGDISIQVWMLNGSPTLRRALRCSKWPSDAVFSWAHGIWLMTNVNTPEQWQDEVQKVNGDHSWPAPLLLALVSCKTSKLYLHSTRCWLVLVRLHPLSYFANAWPPRFLLDMVVLLESELRPRVARLLRSALEAEHLYKATRDIWTPKIEEYQIDHQMDVVFFLWEILSLMNNIWWILFPIFFFTARRFLIHGIHVLLSSSSASRWEFPEMMPPQNHLFLMETIKGTYAFWVS